MHILKRSPSNDGVPAILYDYDDTLGGIRLPSGEIMPGAAAYDDVIVRVGLHIKKFYGSIAAKKVLGLQHEIDMELARTLGFNDKTRFAQSFVNAYVAYCDSVNAPPRESVKAAVYKIGMSVFTDYPYVPMEGAMAVLDKTAMYFKTVIITKGAVDEQERKLRHTGFFEAADDIYVVGKKDAADWSAVREDLGHATLDADHPLIAESWAIGNSAKADVNPLVAMGYNGVHIAGKNGWAFETADLLAPLPGRISRQVADITEVLDLIPGYAGLSKDAL